MNGTLLWVVGALVLALGALGYFAYRRSSISLEVDVQLGTPTAAPTEGVPPAPIDETRVEQRLLEAGLHAQPVLGDTAVAGHLRRLDAGEVAAVTLLQYSDDLQHLNRFTMQEGATIPTTFWDVRTAEMGRLGWDEYSLLRSLSTPEMAPYVRLLAQSYGRFLEFKAAESADADTALDAALDLFALAEAYVEAVPESDLIEHAVGVEGPASEVLLVWQSLVAGTTRTNPLTGKPMFSHHIYARDNVGTMYQYARSQAMSTGEVWGVTGFAPRFVGTASNNNQIEHMSISMVLQLLLGTPVLALNAIEEEKVLLAGGDQDEASADMALNSAIQQEFAPRYPTDRRAAVEHLRRFLKGAD